SGVVNRAPAAPETGPPGWPQIAGSGLMFPREADFRADIDDLVQALDESRVRITAARTLLHAAVHDSAALKQLRDGRTSLEEPYRRTRVLGTIAEVRAELAARGLLVPRLGSSEPQHHPDSLQARWALGTETGWPYGITGALRTVRILLSTVRELICATTDEKQTRTLTGLADTLGLATDRIDALNRAVADALYATALASEEPTDVDIVTAVNARFDELRVPDRLDDLITDAVGAYAAGVGGDTETLRTALEAIEVVTGALAARSEDQSPPAFRFVRLGPEIEHQTFDGPDLGDDKLYGTRLMNFAAFGHREWRMWDWTWGRLDAAAHIARLLTTPDHSAAGAIERFEQQILAAEGTSVAAVEDGLARIRTDLERVPGSKDAGLLDILRSDEQGLTAINGVVESLLRVLGQDQGVPERLHRLLQLVRMLLTSRQEKRIGVRNRILRTLATPVRGGFWRFVRNR
ncbi:MAG: DUF3376 domain-containing protein, partial [Pseudonocardia sp.]|nr:DUF3376 domain-containing protein [Pseudonocardia sp.]